MGFAVKVLADSISPNGHRLTTFEATFPRIILAEVNTHCMLCLAGDSELEFDLPIGQSDGARRVFKMRIDTFVDRWHNGAAPRVNKGGTGFNRQPMRERLMGMRIRQLDEKTGLIRTSRVVDCCYSGGKEVFEVRAGRFRVAGSREHRVLTDQGWKPIGELTLEDSLVVRRMGKRAEDLLDPERLKKIGGRWRSVWQREVREELTREFGGCQRCGSEQMLQIHHIVPVYQAPDRAFDRTNVELLCGECHEAEHEKQGWQGGTYLYGDTQPVTDITFRGGEPTYDLEIEGEFPNFLANGVVVHNSRNSASSRAIPVAKRIDAVTDDPFVPQLFGRNQKGMQPGEALEGSDEQIARDWWLTGMAQGLRCADGLARAGVHKQYANRLLEPFAWHTAVITATDWENVWNLRVNPLAQGEFQKIAAMMKEAQAQSEPRSINYGEWHLPYIDSGEAWDLDVAGIDVWKVSVGRCARVSYLTQNGVRDPAEDVALADRLIENGHMSPLEHVARPMADWELRFAKAWDVSLENGPILRVHWADARVGQRITLGDGSEATVTYARGPLHYAGKLNGWISRRQFVHGEHDILGHRAA